MEPIRLSDRTLGDMQLHHDRLDSRENRVEFLRRLSDEEEEVR